MIEEILKNKERVFNKNGESVNIDSVMIFDNGKVEQHFYHADDLHENEKFEQGSFGACYWCCC